MVGENNHSFLSLTGGHRHRRIPKRTYPKCPSKLPMSTTSLVMTECPVDRWWLAIWIRDSKLMDVAAKPRKESRSISLFLRSFFSNLIHPMHPNISQCYDGIIQDDMSKHCK